MELIMGLEILPSGSSARKFALFKHLRRKAIMEQLGEYLQHITHPIHRSPAMPHVTIFAEEKNLCIPKVGFTTLADSSDPPNFHKAETDV
jgi:hypothetical protein